MLKASALLFLITFLYFVTIAFSVGTQSIISLSFLVLSFLVPFLYLKNNWLNYLKTDKLSYLLILSLFIALSLGVVFPIALFGIEQDIIWQHDAVARHLPWAVEYQTFFEGKKMWARIMRRSGFHTHILVGLFYYLFGGAKVLTTILALLLVKLVTVFFLFKVGCLLINRATALVSCIFYMLAPMNFFYTTAFYKEAMVHLLFVLFMYFLLNSFVRKKYLYLIPMVVVLFATFFERNYLSPFLAITSVLFLISHIKRVKSLRIKLFLTSAIFLSIFVASYNFRHLLDFDAFVAKLYKTRIRHSQFPHINKFLNYELPLALTYFKAMFGPFFTFEKVGLYKSFSSILLWGGILNNIYQGFFLLTTLLIIKVKSIHNSHFKILLPYFLFLLFVAYVAPWNIRVRDSFLPIIILYTVHGVIDYKIHERIFNFIFRRA